MMIAAMKGGAMLRFGMVDKMKMSSITSLTICLVILALFIAMYIYDDIPPVTICIMIICILTHSRMIKEMRKPLKRASILEDYFGSDMFCVVFFLCALVANITTMPMSFAAEIYLKDSSYVSRCSAGLSGTIFAMQSVITVMLGQRSMSNWVELPILSFLMPKMTFIANISGMIGGFFVMIFLDRIANFHNNRRGCRGNKRINNQPTYVYTPQNAMQYLPPRGAALRGAAPQMQFPPPHMGPTKGPYNVNNISFASGESDMQKLIEYQRQQKEIEEPSPKNECLNNNFQLVTDNEKVYKVKPKQISRRKFPSCSCNRLKCNDQCSKRSKPDLENHQHNNGEHFNADENQFLREVEEVNNDGSKLDILQKMARRKGGLFQGAGAKDNGGFLKGWGTYMNKDRRNRAPPEVEDKDRCYYKEGGIPSRVNGGRLLNGYKNAFIRSSERNAEIRGKKDKMF